MNGKDNMRQLSAAARSLFPSVGCGAYWPL
jgi:hypothetical protein